ncbi:MAG TPA: hypothetical protein DCM40_24775 [Maribacter sp.]|nr:hypothetical protein [Maribacter sp.]
MSDNEEDIKWRELSEAESLEILGYHLDGVNQFLVGFDNHRKFPRSKNTFRFTVKVISFDFIISLMEDEAVRNVYFSPSSPPPGGALDAISMRYKVYVEYHEVEDEK